MRRIGFSTGAVARGDFRVALRSLRSYGVRLVELSALRLEELVPLVEAIPSLHLSDMEFVSLHAPSKFTTDDESFVVDLLKGPAQSGIPIVVHPDVIFCPERWRVFGRHLFIENMDKRKAVGRTVAELRGFFSALPDARFCFDVGHARQVDPSMTEAMLLLIAFQDRLAEVHMSEVNTASRHDPLSSNAMSAFASVCARIPEAVPIILEPLIDRGQSDIRKEISRALGVFASLAA